MSSELGDHILNKVQNDELAIQAYKEFSDVGDYIWKAPRLLEHEKKSELKKLTGYFPDDPETASLRWALEGRKLKHIFPYLISVGNLFASLSLFETYLVLLAQRLEKHSDIKIKTVHGQGISKIYKYFKRIGIDYKSVELFSQVDAAIRIRNCLTHASGLLSWSRDNEELKKISKHLIYLSEEHAKSNTNDSFLVKIVNSEAGERLQISNDYSWLVCHYLRDYFLGLCLASRQVDPEAK